ncbi:helix-turn-helix domain-containing protein [Streptomyces sp. 1331.2]|uniref:helix-turn-helix domain-containing protein n=1 Tax=Streptomyces sp. 1331.2 TaxID=1938835 RepID=UPI000BDAD8AF|nr:XRE family transcriptional regulator [Streptomyces sp. 1331.2]SOB84311.1 Transcriptional regulator, contains XRE-family HTH domain [Streptomyces sp. 1331.2]
MGSAWKQLPEELSEPARRLAEELRALKDAAGLSLSELATRTHYSRASWERWLNGKRVVTEQALEALIGAVDCDAPELRRLWRQAVEPTEREAPAAVAEAADTPAEPTAEEAPVEEPAVEEPAVEEPVTVAVEEPAGPARATWWRRPAALVALAAVLALLLVLVGLRISRHDEQASAADEPSPSPAVTTAAKPAPGAPACQAVGCAHKDPKTTGCGKDARTLQTQVVGKVVVYLRYSQTCRAAWAAITEGQPKDYATITDGNGDSETALIHYGYDNYSPMLSAADPAVTFQVCGYQPAGHDCTAVVSDLASVVASTPIPIGPASPPPGTGAGAAAATPDPTETPAAAPTETPTAAATDSPGPS